MHIHWKFGLKKEQIERFHATKKVDYNIIFNKLQSKRTFCLQKFLFQQKFMHERHTWVVHFGHLSCILIMRYTCKAEQTKAEEEEEEENAHFQFHLNLYFRLPFVLGRIECEVLSIERYTCTTAVYTLCVCVCIFEVRYWNQMWKMDGRHIFCADDLSQFGCMSNGYYYFRCVYTVWKVVAAAAATQPKIQRNKNKIYRSGNTHTHTRDLQLK